MKYFLHESSYVDQNCEIGEGTHIWHFSHISENSKIGKNCNLGQNIFIGQGVNIGSNVKIQNNVSIYSGINIEDDVFLGPSCIFTNISNPRAQINRKNLYEKTLVKKGASIGANATIISGIEIGRYAFIAAGSVVTKNVPDYAMIKGVPGKQSGWVSRHGHPLKTKDKSGIMICPESNLKYKLENNSVKCLDFDEDLALPDNLAKSDKHYQEFKDIKK